MEFVWDGVKEAFALLLGGDPDVLLVTLVLLPLTYMLFKRLEATAADVI